MSKKVLVGLFLWLAILVSAAWYFAPQSPKNNDVACKAAVVYIKMDNSMIVEVEGQEVCSTQWEVRPQVGKGD